MLGLKRVTGRVILVGGDREQAHAYQQAAQAHDLDLDYFPSMQELGFLGRFREYDIALVDEELSPLSGLELAEYLEKLFQSLPMILLQRQETCLSSPRELPQSIVACRPINSDSSQIFSQVMAALDLKQKATLPSSASPLLPA